MEFTAEIRGFAVFGPGWAGKRGIQPEGQDTQKVRLQSKKRNKSFLFIKHLVTQRFLSGWALGGADASRVFSSQSLTAGNHGRRKK
jgi:hypothetical protein